MVCMMEQVDVVTAAKMLDDCFGNAESAWFLPVQQAKPI